MNSNRVILHLQSRISRACTQNALALDELQQNYLAHLILRYADVARFLSEKSVDIHTLEYLSLEQLHSLGDECLLRCGLWQLVSTRNLSDLEALVQTGETSYRLLSLQVAGVAGDMFFRLSANFKSLASVLRTMAYSCNEELTLPELLDAWRDNADTGAFLAALRNTESTCIVAYDTRGWATQH